MKGSTWSDPRHFARTSTFRRWLHKNHDRVDELWIGFYRKEIGKPGLTYREALDEALCFGWIDGVRKKVDHERYTNRFTPRRPRSNWSEVNLSRYRELESEGRIAAPGRAAFERRDPSKSVETVSTRVAELDAEYRSRFARSPRAWAFFESQPAGYKRTAKFWVMSAKKPETRERRLARLIEHSAAGKRVPQATGQPAKR